MSERLPYALAKVAAGVPPRHAERMAGLSSGALSPLGSVPPPKREPLRFVPVREPLRFIAIESTTPRDVIREVAERNGITLDQIVSKSRSRSYAWPRQEAMAVLRRRFPRLSLPAIGRLLGNRDHTTVLHGIRAHEARTKGDG